MLTARGWWFLLFVVFALVVSLGTGTPSLTLVSLTLLVWFLAALILFHLRMRLVIHRLRVVRQICDERGTVTSLWAERPFSVQFELHSDLPLSIPFGRATDRVPFGSSKLAGDVHAEGPLSAGQPLTGQWHLHVDSPGLIRFEGVQVQFADLQGFFYRETFARAPKTYRVLPAFADVRGHSPTVKRHNILPMAGPHRHHRPGSGSELLDLRDYIPGDPPKTIAWKVSARRDKLITKEFETEVPLRCTFFVDCSDSVRAGAVGRNALTRLVEITSALAQATAGFRDLPGVCLFDHKGVRRLLRPARTARHVVQTLNALAEVASLSPASAEVEVMSLMPLAYGFAKEVYPDLIAQDVNRLPWWLPIWAPRSPATRRYVPWKAKSLWTWPLVKSARMLQILGQRLWQQSLARLSFVDWVQYRWRKKMAALLTVRYGLSPGGIAYLLENDELFVVYLQRFLADHNIPYAPPLYGMRGEYLYAAPNKIDVLSGALLRSVTRAKDNELFVLLVDLLELEDRLGPLLKAVKVARARHHEVVVVCPWPPGVPLPDAGERPPPLFDPRQLQGPGAVDNFLRQTSTRWLHQAYFRLRRSFGRIGVPMLCAAQRDSVKIVLERLERLRQPLRGLR